MTSPPVRVVLLGLGAINTRVIELFYARKSSVAVVGVATRTSELPDLPALAGAKRISSGAELITLSPDIILEAASRDAVEQWGEVALSTTKKLVLSSTSALVNDDLRRDLILVARRRCACLALSPGALAGIDALSAASRLRLEEVRHRIVKPPENWPASVCKNSSADVSKASILFRGSARDAAHNYPQNANATVVTALAGIGLDKTVVELVSDPSASCNSHEIHARGEFGALAIEIKNRPLPSNPKSSELAALALVRLAENQSSGLVL